MAGRDLIVFDCFGTLLSSGEPVPHADDVVHALMRKVDVGEVRARSLADTVLTRFLEIVGDERSLQPSTETVIADLMAAHDIPWHRQLVDDLLWELLGGDSRYAPAEGVRSLLDELAANDVVVRVLSNSVMPGRLMRRALASCQLEDYFERVRFSGDGGVRKPDPRSFLAIGAGRFTGRLMVGDNVTRDVEPARALGWDALTCDDPPRCWDRVRHWATRASRR